MSVKIYFSDNFNKKIVKFYALGAFVAAVLVMLLRTVSLFNFFDDDIGYYSKGIVPTLMNLLCTLSVVFFVSAVFTVKAEAVSADGKGNCLLIRLASAVALVAFAAYFSTAVFSTTVVETTTFDLLSKITALMGIVYFAISVFCQNANRNIHTLLGFGIIIWCVYAIAVTYFDIYVQLNSPEKTTLHLAIISIMVFLVSELRCFVLQIKKGFYLFSACTAVLFCGMSSVPSLIYGASIGEMNKYIIYEIVVGAIGLYAAARLIAFAFPKKACDDTVCTEPEISKSSEGEIEE